MRPPERRPLQNQRQGKDARLPYGLAAGKTSGQEGGRYKDNGNGGRSEQRPYEGNGGRGKRRPYESDGNGPCENLRD
ncbi:MAG: hypothetical protein P4L00_04590 [Candidatus Acidoferrales bacterium]|nr:hypothetical protein [Candidatus Acidoferrales bacterium]